MPRAAHLLLLRLLPVRRRLRTRCPVPILKLRQLRVRQEERCCCGALAEAQQAIDGGMLLQRCRDGSLRGRPARVVCCTGRPRPRLQVAPLPASHNGVGGRERGREEWRRWAGSLGTRKEAARLLVRATTTPHCVRCIIDMVKPLAHACHLAATSQHSAAPAAHHQERPCWLPSPPLSATAAASPSARNGASTNTNSARLFSALRSEPMRERKICSRVGDVQQEGRGASLM